MAAVRPVSLPPGRATGGTTSVWRYLLVLAVVSLVSLVSLVSPVDSKKTFSPPPAQPIILCSLNVIVCGANGQMYPCREMAPKGMATTTDLSKCRPPGDVIVTPSEAQCPVKAPKVCASDGRNYPCANVAPKGLLTTTDLSACQTPATCPWSTSAYSKSSLALLANECSTLAPSSSSSTPLPITSSLIGCCAATSALLQSTAIATAKAKSPRVNTPAVYSARAGQCMKEFVPYIQSPKAAFAAATAASAAAVAVLSKFNPVLQCGRLGFGAAQFGLEGGKGACRGITTEAQLTSALKASPVWWVSSYMKKDCSSTTGSTGRCSDCAKQVSTLFDALIRPGDTVSQKQRCWALIAYYAASSLGNSTSQSNGIALCLHKNAPSSLLPPGTSIKAATINAPTNKTILKPRSSLPAVKPTIKAALYAADSQQVLDPPATSTFRAAADTSPDASSAPSTSAQSTSATAIIVASVALAVLLAAVVAATILAVRGARHHMHRQRLASSISIYPSGSVSAALTAGTPLKASVSGSEAWGGSSGVSEGGVSREGSVSSLVGLIGGAASDVSDTPAAAAAAVPVALKVPVAAPSPSPAAAALGKDVCVSRFVMDATAAAPALPATAGAAGAAGAPTATAATAAAAAARKPVLPRLASALTKGAFASGMHSPVRRRAGVLAATPVAPVTPLKLVAPKGGEK